MWKILQIQEHQNVQVTKQQQQPNNIKKKHITTLTNPFSHYHPLQMQSPCVEEKLSALLSLHQQFLHMDRNVSLLVDRKLLKAWKP
ncbi:hypothetical protein JRQ81_019245 [Phrynocephalus forsythii]|uniref:Uncharacterized protein n=1 Tax=Phrynocephalus forsythii TaxID=171643 RepID=A0A9Q1AXS9_9SAUR|nr:hypothetical protein JRQ81_019245 [Phrynocephalus forsythii]